MNKAVDQIQLPVIDDTATVALARGIGSDYIIIESQAALIKDAASTRRSNKAPRDYEVVDFRGDAGINGEDAVRIVRVTIPLDSVVVTCDRDILSESLSKM